MGTGLNSKLPSKSPEHPSGDCAETRVAAARAERATAYFMLIVWGELVGFVLGNVGSRGGRIKEEDN